MSAQHTPVNNFNATAVQDYLTAAFEASLADAQASKGKPQNNPQHTTQLQHSFLSFVPPSHPPFRFLCLNFN